MAMNHAAGDGDFGNKWSKGFTAGKSPNRGSGDRGTTSKGLNRTGYANSMKNKSAGGGMFGGSGHPGGHGGGGY